MRFLTRLHVCITAVVILILYFSWIQPSLHIQEDIQTVWTGNAHRLVVFGDDWSDIGTYRVSAPPKSTRQIRDPDRGDLWTETLCKELTCDFIDNFARSIPSNVEMPTVGSLVNVEVFSNATAGQRNETLALFDFKSQVQQFIEFEKKKKQIPGRLRKVDEWTVFTVLFGIWDLLEYSVLDKDEAMRAIRKSVQELYNNLDILADHAGGPIKVIAPKLVDVTFLPRFQMQKENETMSTEFAETQHELIFLFEYWNTALSEAGAAWGKGELFMPDLNGIIMNQVRAKQLHSQGVSDASGFGKQTPLFDDVKTPCLSLRSVESGSDLQAADVEKCFDPARHLFWDDLHLSGPAHGLIGKEAARLVQDSTKSVNAEARERAEGSDAEEKNEHEPGAGFNLKFPPGY